MHRDRHNLTDGRDILTDLSDGIAGMLVHPPPSLGQGTKFNDPLAERLGTISWSVFMQGPETYRFCVDLSR